MFVMYVETLYHEAFPNRLIDKNVKLNSIFNCACMNLYCVCCFKWNIEYCCVGSLTLLGLSENHSDQISHLSCRREFGFMWLISLIKGPNETIRGNRDATGKHFPLHSLILRPFAVALIFPPSLSPISHLTLS